MIIITFFIFFLFMTATINASEYGLSGVKVNGGYDGQYDVLTLSEFLTYAKNQSVNILVDIQVILSLA